MTQTDISHLIKQTTGLVAIVDALGAADYSLSRVGQFLASLNELLAQTKRFADDQAARFVSGFNPEQLNTFVFQDSVVFAYQAATPQVTLNEIVWFSHVLRTFEGGAFQRNLLFRGAWAWGDFYLVNPQRNIVLGPVVRDAARWYEAANWIGIHATPRTGLFVQSLVDGAKEPIDFVMIDYDVPLKGGTTCKMKAINWPKNLHLRYPDSDAQTIRGILQASLVVDPIRPGDEQKQFNALAFFDAVVEKQGFRESWRTRLHDPKAINPASNNPVRRPT